MTPEQEAELFQTLGRMEAKIDSTNVALIAHTVQDSDNFRKLEVGQRELKDELAIMKIADAHAAGIAEEAAKHASMSGGRWGAATGGFISVVIAAIAAYFGVGRG